MGRLRTDFLSGTLSATLTSGATSMSSNELADFPEVISGDYMVIVLDPAGDSGDPEVAYITWHTAGATPATTATLWRAREGTSAREHASGTTFVHGPTVEDFDVVVNTDDDPGRKIYVGDTDPSGSYDLENGDVWIDTAGYASSKVLLDEGTKIAVSDSFTSWSTSSTSLTAVDSSALSVSFTVPSTGSVLITLEGYPHCDNGRSQYWGLILNGTGAVSGTSRFVGYSNQGYAGRTIVEYVLTGLTPGASVQYDWAWAASAGTVYGASGPNNGPWVMRAWRVST